MGQAADFRDLFHPDAADTESPPWFSYKDSGRKHVFIADIEGTRNVI